MTVWVFQGNSTNTTQPTPTTTAAPPFDPALCPSLVNNAYEFVYSCNMAQEALALGAVSLFLTILNIGCIFLMGIAILKVCDF